MASLLLVVSFVALGSTTDCTCYYCGGTTEVRPGDASEGGDRCEPHTATCSNTKGTRQSHVCYSSVDALCECYEHHTVEASPPP